MLLEVEIRSRGSTRKKMSNSVKGEEMLPGEVTRELGFEDYTEKIQILSPMFSVSLSFLCHFELGVLFLCVNHF